MRARTRLDEPPNEVAARKPSLCAFGTGIPRQRVACGATQLRLAVVTAIENGLWSRPSSDPTTTRKASP
jgi:hypothetical protein